MSWLWAILTSLSSFAAETWRNTPAPIKTILVAAFGTLIGAWVTSRSQAKRRIVEELRATHAAYNLCFSIINQGLAFKKQLVGPMKQHHDEAVVAYHAHQRQRQGGVLHIAMDLQTLSQIKFPSDLLEKIVFEKCGTSSKGLAAVIALSTATDDVRNSIELRNKLIADFREQVATMNELQRIQFYVGAPQAGQVDQRFPQNVGALASQTDNIIFFGMTLANELLRTGNRLHSRNRFKYRLGVAKLVPADWTMAREAGLIPDEAFFVNWTKGFGRPPAAWKRLIGWFKNLFKRRSKRRVFEHY